MEIVGKSLLSRLWALSAILCMVATLNAAFISAQSGLLVLEHQTRGDIMLADGGWLSACDGTLDACAGHIESPTFEDGAETMGLNHHHHYGESNSGMLADVDVAVPSPVIALISLRPKAAQRLTGRSTASIDQPPRVLSRT
jgi:hypothetical protein